MHMLFLYFLLCAELILTYAAKRAFKVLRKVFKLRPRRDAAFRYPLFFIIDPSANVAYVFHTASLLFLLV